MSIFRRLLKEPEPVEVKVRGDQFSVVPVRRDDVVLEGEVVNSGSQLPAVRTSEERPAPKVGQIPKHSWGV